MDNHHEKPLTSTPYLYGFLESLSTTFDNPEYLDINTTDSNTSEPYSALKRHLIDFYFLKKELKEFGADYQLLSLLPSIEPSTHPELRGIDLQRLIQPKYNKKLVYTKEEMIITTLLVAHGLLPSHFNLKKDLAHLLMLRLSTIERLRHGFCGEVTLLDPQIWAKLHQYPEHFPRELITRYRDQKPGDLQMRRKGFLAMTRNLVSSGYGFEQELYAMLGLHGAESAVINKSSVRKPFDDMLDTQRRILRSLVKDALGVAHMTHEQDIDKHNLPAEVRKYRDIHLSFLLRSVKDLHSQEYSNIVGISGLLKIHDRALGKDVTKSNVDTATTELETIYKTIITPETLEIMMSSPGFEELPLFVQEFYEYLYFLKKSDWELVSIKDYLAVYKKNLKDPLVSTPGHAALQISYVNTHGKITEKQFTAAELRFLSYTDGSHTAYHQSKTIDTSDCFAKLENLAKTSLTK